ILMIIAVGCPGILSADILNYTGTGTDLNVATFDSNNQVVVGVTRLTIPVNNLNIVDPGNSVTVTLNGLQYPFAGNLRVTLSLKDNFNNVLRVGDVFNRIGLVNSNDVGYNTQFGNTPDSGNYSFNSSFTGNL